MVVADLEGSGPIASAMAVLEGRAHVSQVSTLPQHRRRGCARACLTALLRDLDAEGVARAELHATSDGEALYTDSGFRPAPYPSFRRQRSGR